MTGAEVNLTRADLSEASLIRANLHGTIAHEANFQGANLEGANLTGIWLNGALVVAQKLTTETDATNRLLQHPRLQSDLGGQGPKW